MIQVTKILEGGVDITQGTELPRCLVVSNGVDEVAIPVTNEVIKKVTKLLVGAQKVEVHQQTFGPELVAQPPATFSGVQDEPEKIIRLAEPPPSTDVDEVEFSPGDEYSDTGTGVSSL